MTSLTLLDLTNRPEGLIRNKSNQQLGGDGMSCNACGSVNQRKFLAAVDIPFPRLIDVKKSPVLLYPELLVCLNCGKTEFTVPKAELDLLNTATA
jgi:hypothetical protein